MFCAASATAMPPMPRLATKAVMSMPRFENTASPSTDHSSVRSAHDSSVVDAPAGAWRSPYRRRPPRISRWPHSPACSASAMNQSWPRRSSQRAPKSSMFSPTKSANSVSMPGRVAESMSAIRSS